MDNVINDEEENELIISNNQFENMKEYKTTIISAEALENINIGNKEYNQKLKKEEQNDEKQSNIHFVSRNNHQVQIIGYEINENKTKTIQINQEKFEKYELTEKNGIQWVIKKIEKLDKNSELSLSNIQGYLPKSLFF